MTSKKISITNKYGYFLLENLHVVYTKIIKSTLFSFDNYGFLDYYNKCGRITDIDANFIKTMSDGINKIYKDVKIHNPFITLKNIIINAKYIEAVIDNYKNCVCIMIGKGTYNTGISMKRFMILYNQKMKLLEKEN